MNRLRLGVIGAGAWGRNHVRTVANLPEAKLAVICESDPAIRKQMQHAYPGVLVTDSVDQALAAAEAIVVATPARSHTDLALRSISRGLPTLVEKPFALSVADAERIAEAATVAGVPVLVGHLLEYHPVVNRLRELVGNGDLGQIYYLYSQRVNLGQVRPDENALWSFGPHDISVALYLLGETPIRVAAQGRSYLQPGIEDVVFLTLTFGSGTVAHAQMSWLDPHKARRLTVVGSRQMAVFDDMAPREKLRIYDKGIDRPPEYRSYGESLAIREGDIFIPKLSNAEPLALELQHFVRVARGEEAPRSDVADGVRVVRVLEAASRSLSANGIPVPLEGH